jgi:tRNA (adenine57-N1/adenine58-N1)-methyltransferase
MLVGKGRKQFLTQLNPENNLQTHWGVLRHADLIERAWGSRVKSHSGNEFLLFQPSLLDILLHTKRISQIMYPKDIGYILLKMSVGPGTTVLEAGTGSGALTSALAWAVGASGRVYSYDRRDDMQGLARRNLERLGLLDRVSLHLQDIEFGLEPREVPAVFLDLPEPERYLTQVRQAMQSGGVLGTILPTTNQVSRLLAALDQHSFGMVEVCEVLLRFYKTVADRFRPEDRMIGHTGYLVFARAMQG